MPSKDQQAPWPMNAEPNRFPPPQKQPPQAMPAPSEGPSVEAALAYANGYAAGLDEAENADGAKLVRENGALQAKLAFERALRSDAERRLADHQAWRAEEAEEHKVKVAALQRQVDEAMSR